MSSKKKAAEADDAKANGITDLVRKVLLTGVGAIFMTEQSVRSKLGDLKLPKDAVGYVMDQARRQKDDLIAAVAEEVAKFLSKLKLHEEIQKALSSMQIHVDARLSFSSKGKIAGKQVRVEIEE